MCIMFIFFIFYLYVDVLLGKYAEKIWKREGGLMRHYSTLSLFKKENRPTYGDFGKHNGWGTFPEIVLNWLNRLEINIDVIFLYKRDS